MVTTRRRGFTFVELLVVVAVLAILAAVSYPVYQTQVLKIRRADARKCLLAVAHQLERCYTDYHRYNHPACASHLNRYKTFGQSLVPEGRTIAAPCWQKPDTIDFSDPNVDPAATQPRSYQITSTSPAGTETLAADGESYSLFAIPQGSQARDRACAQFQYDSNAARTATDAAGADATATCW